MDQEISQILFTDRMSQALRFINTTGRHIYLTGKAGTGKTTFLKSLPERTYKQHIIVAPTGIAALNAGGTTIHSQFLLPFGMFIPDREYAEPPVENANWYTESVLARRHPLNSVRKQVLRSIDLMIIDEVSMLRADLLDAIDYRLRAARNNFGQRFGGVQLLLIGDLYQLPPVVKREEEQKLKTYYRTNWFFESKALQQDGFTYIELDKIFRQRDRVFIDLLNNLRHNKPTSEDIQVLNQYYRAPDEILRMREVITLTTHNYKADDMNRRALEALPSSVHYFDAEIEDDFPESMYPVAGRLELKVGAQVMFIRNDSESAMYFNGKLATITAITGDQVTVLMSGSDTHYTLQRVLWENKKYTVDDRSKDLVEDVIGTFSQYPVKLAWAITVHKSQGLTFEKAIIDVGTAFADGQVYVALSRLRSIDGLILRTRIDPGVVSTDRFIVSFDEFHNKPDALNTEILDRQKYYLLELSNKTFDFSPIIHEASYLIRTVASDPTIVDKSMTDIPSQIQRNISAEQSNTFKYREQLRGLLAANQLDEFLLRLMKGMEYYRSLLLEQRKMLIRHMHIAAAAKKGKRYMNDLADLDQMLGQYWMQVTKVHALAQGILRGDESFDLADARQQNDTAREALAEVIRQLPAPRKKKGSKKKKDAGVSSSEGVRTPVDTDEIIRHFKAGKTIVEIASDQQIAPSTVEEHLTRGVEKKRLLLTEFVDQASIDEITAGIAQMDDGFTIAALHIRFAGKYGYGQLRAVISDLVNRDNLA